MSHAEVHSTQIYHSYLIFRLDTAVSLSLPPTTGQYDYGRSPRSPRY